MEAAPTSVVIATEAPVQEVALNEAQVELAPSSSSSSSSSDPASVQQSWDAWIENVKKEYGSPNEWIEANPTAKYYQHRANEFFMSIGQWGHEKALEWFPTLYNYNDRPTRQTSESGVNQDP